MSEREKVLIFVAKVVLSIIYSEELSIIHLKRQENLSDFKKRIKDTHQKVRAKVREDDCVNIDIAEDVVRDIFVGSSVGGWDRVIGWLNKTEKEMRRIIDNERNSVNEEGVRDNETGKVFKVDGDGRFWVKSNGDDKFKPARLTMENVKIILKIGMMIN